MIRKKKILTGIILFCLCFRKSEPISSNNLNNIKNQKENSAEDKKKLEINDNYFAKKNNEESESPDKKQNVDKIQEIKISSKDAKDFNLPKVRIVDVKIEEKVSLIQKNPEKPNVILNNNNQNQTNAENENELIEKHKMLINLYNIEKDIDGDENELETEVEKIKTEDVNSCTRDFNFVVVFIII